MAVYKRVMTVEDFEAFVLLPENTGRLFEFIGGEVVEVPSNPHSSKAASKLSFFMQLYVRNNRIAGHITGEAGGYRVSGERHAPDVAFISKARQPELPHEGYNPIAPDLAVEVVSPTDSERLLRIKIANYLAAGTTLWVVYPQTREVEVYAPGQPVQVLDEKDTLDGGKVLPGFELPLKELFGD